MRLRLVISARVMPNNLRFSSFFLLNPLEVQKFFLSLQSTKSVLVRTMTSHDIEKILRPTMPFVGQVKGKGVYGRYHSVHSNFATLKHFTEDNATRRLRG